MMSPAEVFLFGGVLFLALVCLLAWKRRREKVQVRMSQKLRDFVAEEQKADEQPARETMIRVA